MNKTVCDLDSSRLSNSKRGGNSSVRIPAGKTTQCHCDSFLYANCFPKSTISFFHWISDQVYYEVKCWSRHSEVLAPVKVVIVNGAFNISLNHRWGRGREHARRGRTSARKCIADVTNISTSKTCLLRRTVSVRILSLFRIFLRLFTARKKERRRKTGHTLRRSTMLTLNGSTIESLSSKRSWGHGRQEGCARSGSRPAFLAPNAKVKKRLCRTRTSWLSWLCLSFELQNVNAKRDSRRADIRPQSGSYNKWRASSFQFKIIKLSCVIVLFTNKCYYLLIYYYIIINLFSLKFANVFGKYRNVYCGWCFRG